MWSCGARSSCPSLLDRPLDDALAAGRFAPGLLVAPPLALGQQPWRRALIVLALDEGQDLAQALVLDDRRLIDPLVLVERPVRQGQPLPAHLQPPVCEDVGVDILGPPADCVTAVARQAA